MTDVVISGIGQREVGGHWDIGLRELAFVAIQDAVKDEVLLHNDGSSP